MKNKFKVEFKNAVVYLEAGNADRATDFGIEMLLNEVHPAALEPKRSWIATYHWDHVTEVEWNTLKGKIQYFGAVNEMVSELNAMLDRESVSFMEMVAALSYIARERNWNGFSQALKEILEVCSRI